MKRVGDETEGEERPPETARLLDSSGISEELLRNIPPEKSEDLARAIIAFQLEIRQVERYSGILPHPSIVERYEAALPGSADRILTLAEELQAADILQEQQNAKASHSFNMALIRGVIWNERLGMILLVGLALALVMLGVRIMETGHSGEGFALIVGAACGVLVAYVRSGSRRRQLAETSESA